MNDFMDLTFVIPRTFAFCSDEKCWFPVLNAGEAVSSEETASLSAFRLHNGLLSVAKEIT